MLRERILSGAGESFLSVGIALQGRYVGAAGSGAKAIKRHLKEVEITESTRVIREVYPSA